MTNFGLINGNEFRPVRCYPEAELEYHGSHVVADTHYVRVND